MFVLIHKCKLSLNILFNYALKHRLFIFYFDVLSQQIRDDNGGGDHEDDNKDKV